MCEKRSSFCFQTSSNCLHLDDFSVTSLLVLFELCDFFQYCYEETQDEDTPNTSQENNNPSKICDGENLAISDCCHCDNYAPETIEEILVKVMGSAISF